MYIPKAFKQEDSSKAIAFAKNYPFGTLVSVNNSMRPLATHIPFAFDDSNPDKIKLYSHIARENEHWHYLEKQECLIIFQTPHAYISPSLYTREKSVPTWNYEAVHFYGNVRFLQKEEELDYLMHQMISFLEPDYFEKWEKLDASYKTKLYHALVGFVFEVQEIHAVQKLSQDRKTEEKENIISYLAKSPSEHELLIAESMMNLRPTNKS